MPESVQQASVPVAYAQIILAIAAEHGVERGRMLEGLSIAEDALNRPNARLGLVPATQLLMRALDLCNNPALGYEIGLRSSLSSHGTVGWGLLSLPRFRDALEFGIRFAQLRTPFIHISYRLEDDEVIIELNERFRMGSARIPVFEFILVGLWRLAPQLVGGGRSLPEVTLCFDHPEPDYYPAYRDRLPKVRFGQASNQLRFEASFLDIPMNSADTTAAQLLAGECEEELQRIGGGQHALSDQILVMLREAGPPYPKLQRTAAALRISERSLKRRLHSENKPFSGLLEQCLTEQATQLLNDTPWSISRIATHLGYADPANFTRAFKKWTGATPSQYRLRADN